MGGDKVSSKGGFFNLFDWNRRSRKKLFANGSVSPEERKQERKNYNNLPAPSFRLTNGEEFGGASIFKDCADYSCASSVTDEDGNGSRAPGVVARLMGLDSLPTAGVPEPCSSPSFEPRPLQDRQYHSTSPEYEINYKFRSAHDRTEIYSKKPLVSKTQKMPSSPIERFQTEMLPSRSAKSLPINHYKLLSPIKNPRFISSKDAAHIMEAAAKIIEPGLQANSSARVPSVVPPSLRIRDSKECLASSERTSRFLDSSRKPSESNAMKYLKGRSLNKSWNGSESDTSCRASPDRDEVNPVRVKSKGKSVSLAIQAKVNVQKREALSTSSRGHTMPKEPDDFKSNQPSKRQNTQKDRVQKKVCVPSASGVLKQNNQKQNCLIVKEKMRATPSASKPQRRKVVPGDTSSSGRLKSSYKPQRSSKGGFVKKGSEAINIDKDATSTATNNQTRRKRSINGEYDCDKSGSFENVFEGRHEKHIQHNVIFDDRPKQVEDARENGMEVVSFTFTAPVAKHSSAMRSKEEPSSDFCAQPRGKRHPGNPNSKKSLSPGENILGSDALSILLEQKLRELTLELGPASKPTTPVTNVSILHDPACASEASSALSDEKDFWWKSSNATGTSNSRFLSFNSQVVDPSHKLQKLANLSEDSCSDARKESGHQQPSPFSTLEAAFSYETCNSAESCDSTSGGSVASSSVRAHNISFDLKKTAPSVEAEMEISDSASSSLKEIKRPKFTEDENRSPQTKTCKQEVEYVKEILSTAKLNPKIFAFDYTTKTLSHHLFDKLEHKRSMLCSTNEAGQSGKSQRKALFDCMKECLDSKFHHYFSASYGTWHKGMALLSRGEFADEIYKEISGLGSMGDCMVDELVDRDMSSQFGKWVDFEPDAYSTGADIGNMILGTLISEVVAEIKV